MASTSQTTRLLPAPSVSFELSVQGLPHLAAALLGADGKPAAIPSSVKPSPGKRVGDSLLVCDENGKLGLPKLRAIRSTLHLLPTGGTAKGASHEHAKVKAGAVLHLSAKQLRAGIKIPLDLASARASGAFSLTIHVDVSHVHRCC